MSDDAIMSETRSETKPGSPKVPSSSTNEQTIRKSDKVWFDDGNIILQTATTRYRVHKGVLAVHSSVFKDMLGLPQPVEGTETFEGCPIVRLTDLTEDWDELLPLFYFMRNLGSGRDEITLPLLVAMLRLGHKYGCNRLRDLAFDEIRMIFPSDFYTYKGMLEGGTMRDLAREEFAYYNEFYLVGVALELGIQIILPLLFFTCLKNCDTAELLDGAYHSGRLRPPICQALIHAREQIIMDISDKVYAWWRQAKASSNCTTKENCTAAICREAVHVIGVPKVREVFIPKFKISSVKGLCQTCKDDGISSTEGGQLEIFNKLPSYFSLPEWANLEDSELEM